jgi:hypothetical protein
MPPYRIAAREEHITRFERRPRFRAPSSFSSVVTDVMVLEHPSLHRRA